MKSALLGTRHPRKEKETALQNVAGEPACLDGKMLVSTQSEKEPTVKICKIEVRSSQPAGSVNYKVNCKNKLLGVQQLSLMRFNRDLAPHAEMLNNDTARKEKQYVWAYFKNGGGFRFSNTNLFFCSESVCEDIFWDG